MRVALEVHVLGEIFRLNQFADIVKISANAAERGVRADAFGRGLGQVRYHQAVVIGARRFNGHASEQRVIQIGGFQPGDVGRDLEELLQDRQRAADEHRGHDSVADGECTLQTDHTPIVCHGRKEIDWPNEPEGEREQPNGQTNAKTGADEPAATAHLEREINSGESADQTTNEQGRVDRPKENAAPKANENGSVTGHDCARAKHSAPAARTRTARSTPISGLRNENVPLEARTSSSLVTASCRKMIPNTSRTREFCANVFGMIDPELGHCGREKKQRDDEVLRRLWLLSAENENGQTGDETAQDPEFDPGSRTRDSAAIRFASGAGAFCAKRVRA